MALRFEVKIPGFEVKLASAAMDFDYCEAFQTVGHEPYETLLLDAMLGEMTLFARSDEVEAAWQIVDPLIAHWAEHPPGHFPNYAAGSWGPAVADELIARAGAEWHRVGR
jgi:glucose-6-phosphate 1-dehydrogenase